MSAHKTLNDGSLPASINSAAKAGGTGTLPAASETVFAIRVADKGGSKLHTEADQAAMPTDPKARQLVFDMKIAKGGTSPPVADMVICREISRIEHALQELYPEGQDNAETLFRPYFVRLFHIAQLALEGDVVVDDKGQVKSVGGRLSIEAAKAEIEAIANDLIDDEAPRIKNRHLRELGKWAALIALPALLAYVAISLLVPAGGKTNEFVQIMDRLNLQPKAAANFMLLWVGTMVGVCLSYAFRTTEFSVGDLTKTDSDHLSAQLRLMIVGTLAMLLVLMAVLSLGDVALGNMSIAKAAEIPMLAFVVGAILGIGEQKLSGNVSKRAGDMFGATR